ncbi:MAG: DUF262 domain-containing HNH endonuclease family protein [Nitrospirota bacterium]|nr:DUF262 domain-containing HNH endonuclease family protein [Nitrospirota bacterium]
MNKGIEAKEIYIKDLLGPKFLFQVPRYQRPFTWQAENFEKLFDDIKDSMESGDENYFLGSIILQTIKEKEDKSGTYEVIDGQQRITTLIILIAVARDLQENEGWRRTLQQLIYQEENELLNQPEMVRITVWNREIEFFKDYVLEMGGTLKSFNNIASLDDSKRNMMMAIRIFRDKFDEEKDLVEKMAKFILNNCLFVCVKTGSLISAFRLFMVLNDRGLRLTASDLLKTDALSVIAEPEQEIYASLWETVEDELGRDELENLIGFIRTNLVKEKAKKSLWEEYQEKIFEKNKLKKGKEFIKYLKDIADIYREKILSAETSLTSDIGVKYHNLMSLMRDFIPSSDWISPFIHFCRKFFDEEKRYEFLKVLEKRFVVSCVAGLTLTQRLTYIYQILKKIDDRNNADDIISHEIFDVSSDKSMFFSAIDSMNFYAESYCKYLLLRMDLSILENANIMKSFTGIITVEHILPRNPDRNSEWIRLFTEEARKEWTNKVGNLVLLSRRKNSSANNKPFSEKKQSYYTRGITDFEFTKEIDRYTEWNLENLKSRHIELIKRMEQIWIL